MTLHPGARLGPYEIVAPLGAGGMGAVYRARDTRLGRELAIKLPGGGAATIAGKLKLRISGPVGGRLQHAPMMPFAPRLFFFDELRDDPRFQAIVARVGMPAAG